VVISSHVMSLVEDLCDRAVVIAEGRVLADWTVAEVRSGTTSLEDAFVQLVGERAIREEELAWLAH
jgi:ABC-2 type transport system ATP-binding protein